MTRTRPTVLRWLVWASPLAFALYAPLALLAANVQEVQPSAAARPVVVSLVLGLATIGGSRLVLRDGDSATVLACAVVIGFFSYGHLYANLKELGTAVVDLTRHRYMAPSFAVLIVALGLVLARRGGLGSVLSTWLTAAGWILLVFPVTALIVHQFEDRSASSWPMAPLPTTLNPVGDLPDVFYIVLDGYGREDILRSSYGFDNTPFLDALRSRGFYVADKAMSNYSRTLLSLSSTLNMDYLDRLRADDVPGGSGRLSYTDLLQRNQVFDLFRALGYSMVAFESGFAPTEFKDADRYLAVPGSGGPDFTRGELTAFEGLLLQTTIAKVALDFFPEALRAKAPWLIEREYDNHRARVLFTVSDLSEVGSWPGDQFVFAHVLAPHPPFVFGPHGEEVPLSSAFTFFDECCQGGDYIEGYRGQIEYINDLVLEEIDEVLESTRGEAVIILQGDHGPAGLLDWSNPSDQAMRDRMAILNAYYLPGLETDGPYPSITPVNTFRMIVDGYFGGTLGRLEDMSYFSNTSGSGFIPVEPEE